ncbi:MAG: hypothetical protein ABIG88_00895 [Patescibacteria group bacterium]|nr:hypothetical protein [Patescibacteria group bacterium]
MESAVKKTHEWVKGPEESQVDRFERLSLEGVHSNKVTNPVIQMLLDERTGKNSDEGALIKPEDEWLIFPD